ncbi:hypothetical protein V7149_21465 [Bacillus sp. JJ1503]|uniref:hypothetical protein n=1 Tax=Bacillus sp. JJ1503 TaxID=3122956 RepID=UPI002FFF36B0
MTEVWKYDNNVYCLYTESKEVIRRIKRSYHDFEAIAEYFKDDKLKGIQYKVPISRKRSAFHLASINQ